VRRVRAAVTLAAAAALGGIGAPSAAPDTRAPAKAILYEVGGSASDDDECGSIWSVDPAGGDAVAVIDRGGGDCDPDWAPDGRRFAFASNRDGVQGIFIADATGSNAVRVTRPAAGAKDYMPAWSPDGKRIAFERLVPSGNSYALYVVNANGTNERRLAGGHGFDGTPSWSPDGRIVFVSNRPHGERNLCQACSALYVLRPSKKGGARRITSSRFNALMPAWSHDGKYIAWARGESTDDILALFVMRANTEGVRKLDVSGGSPAWSPDSQSLVYSSGSGLLITRLDGTGRARLSRDGGDGPSWRPTPSP
jgi:Tol biopolymer transport system component